MPQVNPYIFKSREWYRWTHEEAKAMHDIFVAWLMPRLSSIQTVMEVGCGLHDFYENLIVSNGRKYIGLDHDPTVVSRRIASNPGSSQRFCVDFCDTDFDCHADLIFSRAVIDHVADPDQFLRQALRLANRYVYIMTYRPGLPDAENHVIGAPDACGYHYNDLSVKRLNAIVEAARPRNYQIKCVPTGRPPGEIQSEVHVVVEI